MPDETALDAGESYVGATLSRWAREQPTLLALQCESQTVCWAQLHRRVERLASRLHAELGVGCAVALDVSDPMSLIQAFLAVGRSGNRALVLDTAWPDAQRADIDRRTEPDRVLDSEVLSQWLAESEPVDIDSHPSAPLPTPDQPFYVGFTSGSTGVPKGYRRRHASWLASFELSRVLFALQPGDRVMAPGSLATSLHLYGVIQALQAGIAVVLVPRFRPRTVLQAMADHSVSALYGTPTQIKLLLQAAQRDSRAPLPDVRHLIISGAKWPDDTRQALRQPFPNAALTEFYGTSEMSFIALHNDQTRAPQGSVGRPVPGVEVRIGPSAQAPVATGERGRIWVRSALVFDGYECGGGDEIARDGDWLTVGDHGYLDDAGYLYLVGREKRMIVSSGLNLYPEEVEAWLLQHSGVSQAALLGLPDALRGQKVAAVIQSEASSVSAESLRQHCRLRFPASQVPKVWYFLEQWPLTQSGKTDFVALERWLRVVEAGTGPDKAIPT
ncbi:AMP-binding protein [Saccharospirillum impatiens]|uniref:AMP-binding protein n=1 Tax=Saccharospirillum impatiens TaxID=169438 RepID=UPI00041E5771|nr:AMP-binding protein [Saccharospirillum impatiens]